MAARVDVPVFSSRLTNGLGVLLREDHAAPIVSFWVWYRVGSRNEVPGLTGISHWVEHMQFKGTVALAKGEIFRQVSSVGGTLNALTSHDWTAYFETVPADHLDLPLRIEADRMTNSLFDPDEVAAERTVILSERQGAENDPAYVLYEEVGAGAFHAHPYRHMVIGLEQDLRRITRDELFAHYQRYYHPANAFIVAVGDFQTEALFNRIEAAFGSIPEGPDHVRSIQVVEPPQRGERRVYLRQSAGGPYLRLAFHAPEARSPDFVPLLVAEAILSGGPPMGFGGGGRMGRSSRLYRALVASGLARSASSDMSISLDPFLFQVSAAALPGVDLNEVEAIVDSELARLREEPCPAEELARAVRQLDAQLAYSAESVTNQAYWLGQSEIVDTWQRALTLPEELRAVTAGDVQRVAQHYLLPDRRTVGWLEPLADDAVPRERDQASPPLTSIASWGLTGPQNRALSGDFGFQRADLDNGLAILGQSRPESRSVALRLRLPAGAIHEAAAQAGLAHLTARTATRGSAGESFAELSARTDRLGSSLSLDAGRQFVEARVRCLSEDLPEMVGLLAQTLLLPDFPDEQVALVKGEQLGAIAAEDRDTRATADRLLRSAIYPRPNPLGRRLLGSAHTLRALARDDLVAFHRHSYRPRDAALAIAGGIGPFAHAVSLIAGAFGDWQGAPPALPATLDTTNSGPVRVGEELAGKSQADIAVGIATIRRGDERYYALDVANLILGRLGLMGRLGSEVRDRQGLAYYASSQLEPRVDGSLWTARAGVAPQNVEGALQGIEDELNRLRTELVTAAELRDAKSYLVGVLPLALESLDGVAATLLAIAEFDLGLDYLHRYPAIVAAISPEEVRAAARDLLDPARLAVSVAGPP